MSAPESNGKTVLVTGINGFIASTLGDLLLSEGYTLRGTSRHASSAKPLLDGAYAKYKGRVEMVEVPDMTVDGAFDEAVKGVVGIFHTASPINFQLDTVEETIRPAMQGSTVLLNSALKHAGPQLDIVVVTSSIAAFYVMPLAPGTVITEESKAEISIPSLEAAVAAGEKPSLYGPSKIAANRAVWAWHGENSPPFALASVHPSVVMGPPVQLPASGDGLNETLRGLFGIYSGRMTAIPPAIGSGAFVDVRDVARVHHWAFANPAASDGGSFLAVSGNGPSQAIADVLHEAFPERAGKMPRGEPGAGYDGYDPATQKVSHVSWREGATRVDTTKTDKAIGIKWIPFTQSIRDAAEALKPLL